MVGRRWIKDALRIWQKGLSKVLRSAIDNQNLARDETSRVAEQEDRCVSDIPRITHASNWNEPMIPYITALCREPIRALCPGNGTW